MDSLAVNLSNCGDFLSFIPLIRRDGGEMGVELRREGKRGRKGSKG